MRSFFCLLPFYIPVFIVKFAYDLSWLIMAIFIPFVAFGVILIEHGTKNGWFED